MNSGNECKLFAGEAEDKMAIDLLVRDFFMLFSVPVGTKADLSAIYRLFIPEGIIM